MKKCPDNCSKCQKDRVSKGKPLAKLLIYGILLLIAIIGVTFTLNTAHKTKKDQQNVYRYTYPCMGTIADVSFFDNADISEKAAKAVYDELYRLENMCNIFNSSSEISKLNKSAADKPFVCSEELYSLLLKCKKAYELTNGTFDITAKPLMKLWGFYTKKNNIPTSKEIQNTLRFVGLNKVKFNDSERSICFAVDGMSLDLGGVAKGAALDAAVRAAKNAGAKNGIINLGGNICCFGKNQDGREFFEVGVRDPQKRNAIIRKIHLTDSFCATSGNYEKFNIIKGRRYSHIMNPLTGYPVQNMYSATVITQKGIDSDIFSTACFILGKDFTVELCNKGIIKGAFLIYPKNNKVKSEYITKKEKK